MILKFIHRIFQSVTTLKPVGRWKAETCNATINQKVDLSNFDHCGPCGQYNLVKKKAS